MMVFGEERYFIPDSESTGDNDSGFFLRYIGTDSTGAIFKGEFPELWRLKRCRIRGPKILDDDDRFRVVKVDYPKNLIWVSNSSKH